MISGTLYYCSSMELLPGWIVPKGRWGSVIRRFGWRHDFALREAVLEHVRKSVAASAPSRLDSAFACPSLPELLNFQRLGGRPNDIRYEVRAVDPTASFHVGDFMAVTPGGEVDLAWAVSYWSASPQPSPGFREIVAETDLVVVSRLP